MPFVFLDKGNRESLVLGFVRGHATGKLVIGPVSVKGNQCIQALQENGPTVK